ncbi:glycosyltransferase [Saccharolobus islandicus]|uniref:Glycosyltransferases involved in cell wall biogenesis n=1 Tax=Saccharolobus islandicus LAL14/1 TaxID=1241935 RepID=M9UCJ6_SACIS|nr:glycosyltransferase [Sulfolobus islandicus]AGJ62256.1 Glycosyltransferases involved in cell wall biogenesis [Sulfolobus islandicus LAL14/1]
MEPLVSIVIPTLNSAKTIRKTLESIKLLNYPNVELIVVDGKSDDGTLDIVKEYKNVYNLRIVIEERRGRGVAYNRGVLESKGKYVAFLDSDATIATPGWISDAVKVLETDDKVAVVFTKVYSPPDSTIMQKAIDTFLCKGYTTANGAVYRRDAVLKVGGFNEKMNYLQEDELLHRLKKAGYTFYVNYSDYIYHYHRNSLRSYIKQNVEAAKGAKAYKAFTSEKWIVKDSMTRLLTLLISVALSVILIVTGKILLFLALILLFYVMLYIKVNLETCKQYKWSKYTLLAPFLIYMSLIGFFIGYVSPQKS